jgi:hypothetical protein
MRQEAPQVRPEVIWVRAFTWGSFATEGIVLNTAPTAFNQRVPPSRARWGHGDGHLKVLLRTQTMHGNRVPVYRVTVREFAREDTEEREHHSSARVQERQREGAHVNGAPERVDVGWRARSTPPLGRDVYRSRIRGQGCLPGRRSLRTQMIVQATIREGGGRKRSRQLLRGAQHAPQPGMVRCHSSMGGSTEVKGSLGVRPEAFRVSEMSEVTRTFTGQHLTHRQKYFKRDTRTASSARFAGEGADTACQATRREEELIKVQERGRGPRLRVPTTRCAGGPHTSIPYSRTGRMTEWMMHSWAATLMRGDASTGHQV